ncbi:hypothetical protein GCM10020256_18290 [Streptomyces thermocoprophilus]
MRTVERGAVAADQKTAAPPGAPGAAGVGGDTGGFLLDGVQTAVDGDLDQRFTGQRGAQHARDDVLSDVQRAGVRVVVERDRACHLPAPHRPPSGPTRTGLLERHPGETFQQGGGVLVQHDGAGETGLVLAGALVEEHGRHLLTGQRQREREPDGPRPDDDHRVHGATPPARSGALRDMGEQKVGAGCTVTERMQPIAGACVK